MQNSSSQTNSELLVELLQVEYLQAAIDLEREAGLGPTELVQMLNRLQSPSSLLLGAFREFNAEARVVTSTEQSNHLIGLLTGWLVLDELEIDSFVVTEAMRGQGVGRVLLTEGLRIAQQRGVNRVFLEVREDNLPALSLYRSCGFTVSGRRKDYYREPRQDALLLSLNLQGK